ncbi:MAG: hypothetical protein QMC67_05350 [Candidatus Wallbacteria bacterium]
MNKKSKVNGEISENQELETIAIKKQMFFKAALITLFNINAESPTNIVKALIIYCEDFLKCKEIEDNYDKFMKEEIEIVYIDKEIKLQEIPIEKLINLKPQIDALYELTKTTLFHKTYERESIENSNSIEKTFSDFNSFLKAQFSAFFIPMIIPSDLKIPNDLKIPTIIIHTACLVRTINKYYEKQNKTA